MLDIGFYFRSVKYFFTRIKFVTKGYQIGKFFMVGINTRICKKGFEVGDCSYIGPNCFIGENVKLGHFCMISDHVHFIGCDHIYGTPGVPTILGGRPKEQPETVVGDDVWIGRNVSIMRGVVIGDGSIIGANSVVTKNVAPYTIVAGVPAKEVRHRFSNEDKEKHVDFLKKYREGIIMLLHDRTARFQYIYDNNDVSTGTESVS